MIAWPKISVTDGDAFADQMHATLRAGSLAVMLGIGHRAGLFDVLEGRPPATVQEIAAAAGWNACYLRTWLDAMFYGGVLDHDVAAGTYHLPADRAAWLTRGLGLERVAAFVHELELQSRTLAHLGAGPPGPSAARVAA